MRAVWLSYITHDVSPAADATPLWIPQLSMALGCIGFALVFLDAIVARWQGAHGSLRPGLGRRVE
jgi:TRAP-type C4-dicarboxylate transport system permease small subunit